MKTSREREREVHAVRVNIVHHYTFLPFSSLFRLSSVRIRNLLDSSTTQNYSLLVKLWFFFAVQREVRNIHYPRPSPRLSLPECFYVPSQLISHNKSHVLSQPKRRTHLKVLIDYFKALIPIIIISLAKLNTFQLFWNIL